VPCSAYLARNHRRKCAIGSTGSPVKLLPWVMRTLGDEIDPAVSLVVADGRITRIYAIRNPHKLARLDEEATLSR
jgi:hypothetical protein